MNVTVETSGSLMVAYLTGELDHHTAGDVRTKIDNEISYKKPTHLILDFKNISRSKDRIMNLNYLTVLRLFFKNVAVLADIDSC